MKDALTLVLSVTPVHHRLNVPPEHTIQCARVLRDMVVILTHSVTDQSVAQILTVLLIRLASMKTALIHAPTQTDHVVVEQNVLLKYVM